MITEEKDKIISQLTVRLRNQKTDAVIGTGILYYEKRLKDKVYIFTAAHCLYKDDSFKQKHEIIKIDLYNSLSKVYSPIIMENIDEKLISKDSNKDVAVIILDKEKVQKITGNLPNIEVSNERQNHINFVAKGFPMATQGEELDAVFPIWKQRMTEVDKFQLELTEDYNDFSVKGFSGSGIFLISNETIYLYGLFTRYRSQDQGKVIYCQFVSLVNELLTKNYLPNIKFSYLGNNGLSSFFFDNHIKKSVKNLGPRFDEILNFKLPIAKLFSDLSFDDNFKFRFYKVLDKWLLENIYNSFPSESNLKYIDDIFFDLKIRVKKWGRNTPINIEKPIDINWLVDEIYVLNSKIEKEEDRYRELRYEEEKRIREENKDKLKQHYGYSPRPYEKEINRLRKINEVNNELLINLDEKVNILLSNKSILILDGEAGSGKSHLFGDIANERLKSNLPTVFLLGQHFTTSRSLEKNIIHLLDLKCSFEELLIDLNTIGKQIGTRVLILIDAINEGAGGRLWRDQIQGLIASIEDKLFIGLGVSIRTTYLKSIIPDNLKNNKDITFKTHLGFKGNEYAALRLFCDFHNLKQPSFPILSPEFTNPLFLKIICEGVKNSSTNEFPQGFQGVKKVFDLFIGAVNKKLENKREEYINRKIVIKVIHELAFKIFESEYKRLLLDEVFIIMDMKFSSFKFLLTDLIEEGIFIKNLSKDYESGEDVEVIYFAYERFGDFYIANELLKNLKTKKEVINAFKRENTLGKLLEDEYYMNDGVLESMSTLLPEKYNLEIFEVFSWSYLELNKFKKLSSKELYSNNDYHHFGQLSSSLSRFFLNSLNWRNVDSIDDKKITKWLRNEDHRLDDDAWFLKLIELTAIKNHPMNSDRLFRVLSRYSMAERDSFWQLHLRYFNGNDDNGNAFPVRRLIDWAWSYNITNLIDRETARLCGLTLSWVLTSTNRVLRDQTTKALVNLLENQSDALISILKSFESVDDLYIRERLYAISYGCVLRTSEKKGVEKISQYIYNSIFKLGNPPEHILLRDYARNTIEYAIYKKLNIKYDLDLITPPYNSKIPELPTEQDITKYKINHEDDSFDKEFGSIYNGIHFSVIDWDFGNKTIDPELSHFNPISFTVSEKCKNFLNNLDKKEKKLFKYFKMSLKLIKKISNDKERYITFFGGEDKYNVNISRIEKLKESSLDEIFENFRDKDLKFIRNTLIPYLEDKLKYKNDHYWSKLESKPYRRWIVQRVFDLGYNMKLHGRFDKNFSRHSRSSDSIKIGAKYTWIAYHEILSIIADNFKIESRYQSGKKFDYFKGTWQLYARDIDPVSTTITNDGNEVEDDVNVQKNEKFWWSKVDYNYWDRSNTEWSESLDDLPKTKEVIIKTDDNGDEWVYLEYYSDWKEPKRFGEERYFSQRKNLHYIIQGYLVKNKERDVLLNYLENKNFFGRWMPENREGYSTLFNREKFWSPAYLETNDEPEWSEIRDNETYTYRKQKVMIATTGAKGSISNDKSGANFNYNIPCKTLFEGLELEYSNVDGDFINKKGETIVTNISKEGTLIKKEELLAFLDRNDLSIIWTLLGEKIAESENRYYHFGVPCGVYYLDKGSFNGKVKMFKRD